MKTVSLLAFFYVKLFPVQLSRERLKKCRHVEDVTDRVVTCTAHLKSELQLLKLLLPTAYGFISSWRMYDDWLKTTEVDTFCEGHSGAEESKKPLCSDA